MAKQSFPILITRPEPQASRLAAELTDAYGARAAPLLSPLMMTEILTPQVPSGPFAAVILTSEAGAAAAERLAPLPRPAFCVGTRTAIRAAAAGFIPTVIEADAAALVATLGTAALNTALPTAAGDTARLLWLRGADRAADLAALLPQCQIEELIVYAQRPRPLTAAALDCLGRPGPVILPLFSPRSVRLFLAAAPSRIEARLLAVAISAQVAAEVPAERFAGCRVADTPDGAGMLVAIGRAISSGLP
ncbi:MAG: uroporphyrinogen-III synthase [Rhodobacteraceae bacterium]|jgi:uroporphyrinogen-III synthase|nr:uroporphyrinogen-III synthase [Paracoccaceae bacterium]